MSMRVARIWMGKLTDTDTRGGSKNSSVLLLLENGPNSLDRLMSTQEGCCKMHQHITDLVSAPVYISAAGKLPKKAW